MFEGKPLQYYLPSVPIPIPSNNFSYFNRFQSNSPPTMSDELMMPHSPNGSQSDSDNSVSSIEIPSKEIRGKKSIPNNSLNENVQCRWASCGILFESLDQLAAHVGRVHAASGPGGLFYCGWEGCSRNNKGFNARYKMLVHVRTHTNEKPHRCCQCEKSFSRAENLKIHSRSHSGEKPYVCPVPGCHKAYSNSSDRFKHTRTHQVDKPYQCKVPGCPKRYTDPSSLRKHVKTYKHFVNENEVHDSNTKPKENVNCIETKRNSEITDTKLPIMEQCSIEKGLCTCAHPCCISNTRNKTTELLTVGKLINLKNKEITSSWDKILDPFISQPKIFRPYELDEEEMDMDMPLDLSISRRHV